MSILGLGTVASAPIEAVRATVREDDPEVEPIAVVPAKRALRRLIGVVILVEPIAWLQRRLAIRAVDATHLGG